MKHVESTVSLKPFYDWRDKLSSVEKEVQRFDEWVFLNASSVLLSEKTGELLSFSLVEMGMTRELVATGLERLSGQWGFSFRILHANEKFLKLIIYQQDRLQRVLDETPFCIMGAKLNYRFPLRGAGFLEAIEERWEQAGSVPHEIGLALGYPMDDVFGYMGLLPLPCLGVCGWQVYGCMKESKRRSCAFNDARCRALMLLAKIKAA